MKRAILLVFVCSSFVTLYSQNRNAVINEAGHFFLHSVTPADSIKVNMFQLDEESNELKLESIYTSCFSDLGIIEKYIEKDGNGEEQVEIYTFGEERIERLYYFYYKYNNTPILEYLLDKQVGGTEYWTINKGDFSGKESLFGSLKLIKTDKSVEIKSDVIGSSSEATIVFNSKGEIISKLAKSKKKITS